MPNFFRIMLGPMIMWSGVSYARFQARWALEEVDRLDQVVYIYCKLLSVDCWDPY